VVVDADGGFLSRMQDLHGDVSEIFDRLTIIQVSDFISLCDCLITIQASRPNTLLCIDGFTTHANLKNKAIRSRLIHTAAQSLRCIAQSHGTCIIFTSRPTSQGFEPWQTIASSRIEVCVQSNMFIQATLKKSSNDIPTEASTTWLPSWVCGNSGDEIPYQLHDWP
jgi:hypothetical protein